MESHVDEARTRLRNALAELEGAILEVVDAEVSRHLDKREELLRVAEAANLLKVSPNTIYREVQAGRLGLVRIRGSSRVRLSEVKRLLVGT